MSATQQIVTNRIFLLGLDELYREAMKRHEASELLVCARTVATALNVEPIEVPIEGYYTESDELTEYFQLVRSLQNESSDRAAELNSCAELQRLVDVTSSSLFGPSAVDSGSLLPAGKDSLTVALENTYPDWTIDKLVDAAYDVAVKTGECSLVGLASLAKDGVVLAAVRESVVLYAQMFTGGCGPKPEYIWNVDDMIEERAREIVATFNRLFDDSLPEPSQENAKAFCNACGRSTIAGRCVRIGFDDSIDPVKQYHWAIDLAKGSEYKIVDFWDEQIWTTEQYRQKHRNRI